MPRFLSYLSSPARSSLSCVYYKKNLGPEIYMIFISSCGFTSQPCWLVHWNLDKICIKTAQWTAAQKNKSMRFWEWGMLDNNNSNWKQYSKWVLGSSNVELMGTNYSSLVGQEPETKVQWYIIQWLFVACNCRAIPWSFKQSLIYFFWISLWLWLPQKLQENVEKLQVFFYSFWEAWVKMASVFSRLFLCKHTSMMVSKTAHYM